MDRTQGEDLGYGVRVAPSVGDEVIVTSPRFDLGWQVRAGKTPGTAVLWREWPYEVVGRQPAGAGDCWTLRPWDEATAMRTVFTLDPDSVCPLGEEAVAERRGRWTRVWTLPFLPLLGMAPARLQKRWSNLWDFPAGAATWVSAIAEVLVGTLGTMQMVALAWGGDFFLPGCLRWLVVAGPVLLFSGLARMTQVAADGEPVGSPFGLPLALLLREPRRPKEESGPEVRHVDEDGGSLELVSAVHRADWDRDGILSFRGRRYRLDSTWQEGRQWVYRFNCSTDQEPGDRALQLQVPPNTPFAAPQARSAPPSLLGTALVTACVTLGPRPDQERWAEHLGIRPIWLTLVGASAELVGGVVNIGNDANRGVPLLLILDLFLVGEGLLRLAGGVLSGRPVGSIFGWILRPLYRRWL
ncbi:MAG: hypothetical protein KAJ97_01145 [Acidobacteria bacterium]|nr:hypothetical protein [Acidobacteriota bacterium]